MLVRKANGGIASARNAGAEAAIGDSSAVLDADDRYHPRRLRRSRRSHRSGPDLDLITTDARFVVDGEAVGSYLADNPFATHGQRARSCELLRRRLARGAGLLGCAEVGGFDESLTVGLDWDCWLRMILDGSGRGSWTGPTTTTAQPHGPHRGRRA